MSKRLFTFISLLITIGMGLVIVGVVLPCAVKVCMQERKSQPPHRFPLFLTQERLEKDFVSTDDKVHTLCLQQGLFFVGIQEKNSMSYIVTPLENRSKQIRVVAGLLLIGGIGALFSELIFIVGACQSVEEDPKRKQLTIKRGVVGTIILAVSFVLILSGLSMYTSLKVQGSETGKKFLLDVGSALSGIGKDRVMDYLPNLPSLPHNMQEMSSLATTGEPKPTKAYNNDNVTELLSMCDNDALELLFSGIDSSQNPVSIENNFVFPLPGRVKQPPRKLRSFPGMMTLARFVMSRSPLKPHFGYAFYMSWIGAAFMFLSLVIGVYFRIRQGYIANIALGGVLV